MNENIIQLTGSKQGPFAHAEWCFRDGEQWVVTGPNNSGKTYLAALLTDQIPCRGVVIELADEVEGHVAFLTFGQQQLQTGDSWLQSRWHDSVSEDELTVGQFLSFGQVNEINPFEVRKDDTVERNRFNRERKRLFRIFGISELAKRKLVQLSNGETRRALFVRALLKFPKLLILDDPFAGLDPFARAHLKTCLNELAETGMHLLMMLRNPDEIPSCATHLLRLEKLRIVEQRPIRASDRRESEDSDFSSFRLPKRKRKAHTETSEAIIEMRNVTVRYGKKTIFEGFNWTVRQGERWLVIGPNGSGKTTLMSLIDGDNPAAYGEDVRVFGQPREPGHSLWEIRKRIGVVSPELQVYFPADATVREAIFSGCIREDGTPLRPTTQHRQDYRSLLARFGLTHDVRTAFGSLSAGRQRLVLLARALLPRPDLLILDEPCLNLDENSQRLFLSELETLFKERRKLTVLYVAHRSGHTPAGMTNLLICGETSGEQDER
ncbi:MAG: ATP-binding cassette domain-containing protein [Kiritimatiellae bacterium]|nr:ATP-binding cassette domain-containing protein [Kiritimatiellia bacterium]